MLGYSFEILICKIKIIRISRNLFEYIKPITTLNELIM